MNLTCREGCPEFRSHWSSFCVFCFVESNSWTKANRNVTPYGLINMMETDSAVRQTNPMITTFSLLVGYWGEYISAQYTIHEEYYIMSINPNSFIAELLAALNSTQLYRMSLYDVALQFLFTETQTLLQHDNTAVYKTSSTMNTLCGMFGVEEHEFFTKAWPSKPHRTPWRWTGTA